MHEPEQERAAALTAAPPDGEWVAVALSPAELNVLELVMASSGKSQEEVVADAVQQFLLEQGWTPAGGRDTDGPAEPACLLIPLTPEQMTAMRELSAGIGLRTCPGDVVLAALVRHAARYNWRWPYPGGRGDGQFNPAFLPNGPAAE